MWRWALPLIFFWTPTLAQPAECVDAIAAWTTPYSTGDIQFATYYLWQQVPPPTIGPGLLSVQFRSGEFHLHVGVPQSVANSFTSASSGDGPYNSKVKKTYHQALVAENFCPLLNEDGTYLLGETP